MLLSAAPAWAGVSGRISGTVKDATGSLVPDATVVIKDTDKGLTYRTHTDGHGYFDFAVLPVGHYVLDIDMQGFGTYERRAIALDVDAALTLDATLQLSSVSQNVTVIEDSVHVETTSTELGQVITGQQITAVPLNGRSYTDLLSLQPGVAPMSASTPLQDAGATSVSPSGTLNPGTLSVNGQRETSNFFSVNGSDVEEDVNAGSSIIPNLDSIEEFRIITANYDAEYGEYSGGQINVVTKSGTNAFHGNVFEFLRNTALDARDYFSPTRGVFRQNQFGGTFGGPVIKDKLFFFVDYQGTRLTQGVATGQIAVPSAADRTGDLSDKADQLTGSVSGPYIASILEQKLGYAVDAGEPYYVPGCTSSSDCVFPNAVIPQSAWSGPAQHLLQYIPAPNSAGGFSTSSFVETLNDNKGAAHVDWHTGLGIISGYYFKDNYYLVNPYPVTQGGASVPGFAAATTGGAQLFALSDTKTFGATLVNDIHASFLRNTIDVGQPLGGLNVSLASQGFVDANGKPGIVALDPKGQSVENLVFNAFSTGTATNELKQVNNIYQVADTITKVLGSHTMKFGAEFHDDQVNATPVAQFNGSFVFNGQAETGVDFADFLIGAPSQYNQSQINPFYDRNKYVGGFAQDSWRATHSLTVNYGLRWDRIAPWSEKFNQISTFVPGAQSVVFPGAPRGVLFPGDAGVPNTLGPISNRNFSPRIGFAWSPEASSHPFHITDPWTMFPALMNRFFGKAGDTSIRASYGVFYTAIDAGSLGPLAANAPYGTTYTSPQAPLFATPFINASDGVDNGQPFPYKFAPLNTSASHPDNNVDWSTYEPISGIPGYDTHNRTPYTEQFSLSIERQVGSGTVFDAAYVGSTTHHQRVLIAENAGNPALCLSLSQPNEVMPGTQPCGAFGEDQTYYPIGGGVVDGTRQQLGPEFGANSLQSNIGRANYNSLQLGLRHTSGRLQFDIAYTYGKSLDESSNIGEEVNPFNPRLSYALSAFDVKHDFVLSYDYRLPFDKLFRPNRATRDWSLSGITRFSTGFPVTMIYNNDNSLTGTNPNGINDADIDEPDYSGGSLQLNHNPRGGTHNYFNAGVFTPNQLGEPGTSKRRFFYGPGADNFDVAVQKKLAFTESHVLLFRVEAFNVFNHAQFNGPATVDGNYSNVGAGGTFGHVIAASPPRIMQAAAKFSF